MSRGIAGATRQMPVGNDRRRPHRLRLGAPKVMHGQDVVCHGLNVRPFEAAA